MAKVGWEGIEVLDTQSKQETKKQTQSKDNLKTTNSTVLHLQYQ